MIAGAKGRARRVRTGFELGGSPARLPVSYRFRRRRDECLAPYRHVRRRSTAMWVQEVAGLTTEVSHVLNIHFSKTFVLRSISVAWAHAY